ncbi:hypothetical protein Barb4_01499 [Bacteroidales bacterium Barb4]|nr:hypothetical protein Barb4_01499 [Bacteroidales bacterium Barb4]
MQMMINTINIRSSFQDFPGDAIFNPTFRSALCGAEISYPFRAFA